MPGGRWVTRRFLTSPLGGAADGFVVQTGDPEGPAEGFMDPSTGEVRTIPLELMVEGDKEPVYHDTLEVGLLDLWDDWVCGFVGLWVCGFVGLLVC